MSTSAWILVAMMGLFFIGALYHGWHLDSAVPVVITLFLCAGLSGYAVGLGFRVIARSFLGFE